jgi:hypothetical protein
MSGSASSRGPVRSTPRPAAPRAEAPVAATPVPARFGLPREHEAFGRREKLRGLLRRDLEKACLVVRVSRDGREVIIMRVEELSLLPLPFEETLHDIPFRRAITRGEKVRSQARPKRLGIRLADFRSAPPQGFAHVVLQAKGCGFFPQPPVFMVLRRARHPRRLSAQPLGHQLEPGPPCRRGRAASESGRRRV